MIAGGLVSWAAAQHGDRPSLVFGDQVLSHADVERLSNRWAQALLALGLAPGERVAVLLDNSVHSVASVFGVEKAALTYVALNARHTLAEQLDVLADAEPAAVIVGPAFVSLAQAFAVDPTSRTVRWPPGRYSSYSNSGAGLAALVIERTTGQRYEDFVTTRILRPLGMRHAGFAPTTANDPRRATGYDSDGVTPMPYWHTLYRAFGGLDATVGDMGAWVQWLIDPARTPIVPAGDVLRMERPATTLAARAGLAHGYGLGLYRYVHDGIVFTGHGGDADGYLSRLGYHRASRRGYFLVINAFRGEALRAMQEAVEDALAADIAQPDPPATPKVPASTLTALAGCYAAVTQRFPGAASPEDPPLQVAVVDGGLVTITANGRLRALIAVGNNTFRRDDEPVATSAFVDDDGRWMLQGEMGNLRRLGSAPHGPCSPARSKE